MYGGLPARSGGATPLVPAHAGHTYWDELGLEKADAFSNRLSQMLGD